MPDLLRQTSGLAHSLVFGALFSFAILAFAPPRPGGGAARTRLWALRLTGYDPTRRMSRRLKIMFFRADIHTAEFDVPAG